MTVPTSYREVVEGEKSSRSHRSHAGINTQHVR